MTLAFAMLLVASCSGHSLLGSKMPPSTDAVEVQITQVTVGNAVPREGALSYIRIERATGATMTEKELAGSKKLVIKLDPGAYRLLSWQRVCDGNCGNLDPPSDRCARSFTMRQHEPLQAIIRVNFVSGCVIVLRRLDGREH